MITYLLPLLICFTGGRLVGGDRGGVVGAITTMGVIVGADMPMFLGSMIAGPLGGWAIKSFDRAVDGKIKSGFEMLVNNFSAGIIGMLLALLAFLAIGPLVEGLSHILAAGVNLMVQNNLPPLTSIFVEPAKILFLNNAINHGIFSPLGIQQASEAGKSIFFLIEANPGPGMGVLVAYMIFGRGSAKQSADGAAIIHFLGGIHEIYFPYVLMAPRLLLAVILGQLAGHATIREAILDQKVRAVVQGAMQESGAVLIKRYGFDAEKHAAYIQKILTRFENPYLKDDVERVGRQPLRKLSAGDRLIKPTLGTLEYQLPHASLVQGIAAAMHYRSEADPQAQAQELASLIAQKGPQAALAEISGLDANSEVVSAYHAMA